MKTSGQNADTHPGRFCSTCDAPLSPQEYDLCDECREELGLTEEDRFDTPTRGRDDDWR